jgi:hypothetical protein
MDPRRFNPLVSIPFLVLIQKVYRDGLYEKVKTFNDLIQGIGVQNLTDITHTKELAIMQSLTSLPDDFSERMYQFCDPILGPAVIDVTFRKEKMVGFRGQVFFRGFLSGTRAKSYFKNRLIPCGNHLFGYATSQNQYSIVWSATGLVSVARRPEPEELRATGGPNYVSMSVNDERFASVI